jgi:putative tryptophan/tyrosine transport system substrate-binding protein
VTWFSGDLAGKRLALLDDVVPAISTVGLLINPKDPEDSSQLADAQDAACRFNLKLVVLNASNEREIDAAFATFAQQQVGAVISGSDPFLLSRRKQIISLAARHSMPGIYAKRVWPA